MLTIAGLAGNNGSADGIASEARFNCPMSVTYTDGYLYITDLINHTVRKLYLSTGEVTTLAGTAGMSGSVDGIGSSARFSSPEGITTDGVNLYVSDRGNYVIRKIAISTGEVTTFVGAGLAGTDDGIGASARFITLGGITLHGNYLFLTDNNRIRQINITTLEVTTFAGSYCPLVSYGATDGYGSAALFRGPSSITVFRNYLFVTESGNNCIRKIE